MIPISFEQKLEKTIDGVTYMINPMVGEFEIKISTILRSDTSKSLKKYYEKALETVRKRLGLPKKFKLDKKTEDLISDEILGMKDEDDYEGNLRKTDRIINMIICGWSGCDVPFPENPAELMQFPLKNVILEWYWTHNSLNEEDEKK